MNITKQLLTAAVAVIALATASNAHAFGNACKNVTFKVTNNFAVGVTVTRVDLWSQSEGRWLQDDFKNSFVKAGGKEVVVREGEDVEHGENDLIGMMKVFYNWTDERGTEQHSYDVTQFIPLKVCHAYTVFTATLGE
jgi:hypothetical protein